jgi:hypothetical protein
VRSAREVRHDGVPYGVGVLPCSVA